MTSIQLKILLVGTAAQALGTPPADIEASQLQSIIGMVSTLIAEGRLTDLSQLLAVHFPAYYITPLPLTDYPPISTN